MSGIQIFRNDQNTIPFAAGETIFAEGQPGDRMYAVVEGEVNIVKDGKVIETVLADGIFGEVALIDNLPRSASAVAKTDCRVTAVDAHRFMRLVQDMPSFALQVMEIMAARLRRNTAT